MSSFAARQALASGEWREVKDPSTGKSYYFNKQTNRTVWDLEKELSTGVDQRSGASVPTPSKQQPPARTTTAPASPSPALGSVQRLTTPQTEDLAAMASELVERGVWRRVAQADRGGCFYQHAETGETTRDLALYLEIQAAVGDTGALLDDEMRHTQSNPSATIGMSSELRGIHGELLNASDLLDVDTWITLFLARQHGGDYDVAARRLLHQVLRRTGQWEVMQRSEARLEELERQREAWTMTCAAQKAMLAQQATELEELRSVVFYGIEGLQVAATRGRQQHGSDGGITSLPHAPSNASAALQRLVTSGEARNGPGRRDVSNLTRAGAVSPHLPAPSHVDGDDRTAVLERLVETLQHKNRQLAVELDEARRGQHRAVVCPSCSEADPWRRLLTNTTTATSAGVGTTRSNELSANAAPPARSRPLAGAAMLPKHLVSPTTKAGTTHCGDQEHLSHRQQYGSAGRDARHLVVDSGAQRPLSHMLMPHSGAPGHR